MGKIKAPKPYVVLVGCLATIALVLGGILVWQMVSPSITAAPPQTASSTASPSSKSSSSQQSRQSAPAQTSAAAVTPAPPNQVAPAPAPVPNCPTGEVIYDLVSVRESYFVQGWKTYFSTISVTNNSSATVLLHNFDFPDVALIDPSGALSKTFSFIAESDVYPIAPGESRTLESKYEQPFEIPAQTSYIGMVLASAYPGKAPTFGVSSIYDGYPGTCRTKTVVGNVGIPLP